MRRPTAIVLIVLFVALAGAALYQFTQDPPTNPYPGPVSGTPLPPRSTPSTTT